jgi:hypothetical protein
MHDLETRPAVFQPDVGAIRMERQHAPAAPGQEGELAAVREHDMSARRRARYADVIALGNDGHVDIESERWTAQPWATYQHARQQGQHGGGRGPHLGLSP